MKRVLVFLFLYFSSFSAFSQKIDYSLVDRDDFKEMNFEIIGRMGNNINIYKNNRNRHDISVYDNDMQIKNRIKLDFMPEKVYTVDFVSLHDLSAPTKKYSHLFYGQNQSGWETNDRPCRP